MSRAMPAPSLKGRLLTRLIAAQLACMALSVGLFPVVAPFVSYSSIADFTFRSILIGALRRDAAGGLRLDRTPEVLRYLGPRPDLTFAARGAAAGRAVAGSAPGLADVLERIGPYLPLEGGSLATRAADGTEIGIQTEPTPYGPVAFATAGNAFRAEDLPSFVAVFLPGVWPMFGPLLFGTAVVVPLVVGRALRPLRAAAADAARIDLASLDRRIAEAGMPRELLPLVGSINAALDRLDEGVARQRRYHANAAHEMRTPLAVLQARVDALADGAAKLALRRDVLRLTTLAEQMLTAACLVQGPLRSETVDLTLCARDVLADRAPLAIRGGRQVALAVEAGNAVVSGSARALSSVVANLLDNALRAEPAGGTIVVGLSAPRPGWVRLDVADHGEGIAPEDRERVFEPFWRKDERPPGSGLGLAIVRDVVSAHGGRVRAEETPGGGATFRVELPLAPAGPPPA